jgi:hypothetical protein
MSKTLNKMRGPMPKIYAGQDISKMARDDLIHALRATLAQAQRQRDAYLNLLKKYGKLKDPQPAQCLGTQSMEPKDESTNC